MNDAIVLLHGWASHPQVFRGFTRALEKQLHRRDVRSVPLPGYDGATACTPYTLEGMADALAAAAPKSCCVIGWSLGAQVALTWAQRKPAQVRSLALIAATPCFTQRSDWPHATTPALLRQFTAALASDAGSVLRRFVALQARGDRHVAGVAHKLRMALFTHALPPQAVLAAGLEILRVADLRALLPSIAQPTLLINGACDAVTPSAAGAALAQALPHAEFYELAGAGHAPFLSDPDGVAGRLQLFFDETIAAVRAV